MVMVTPPSKKKEHSGLCWSYLQRWCLGACLLASFVIILGYKAQNSLVKTSFSDSYNHQVSSKQCPPIGSSDVIISVQRETIQGTDVLFAEPPTLDNMKPKGILFVAHGCSHSNTDWFKSTDCEGCIGLPEERAIVQIGLDHGLVVVAISSSDRQYKCWDLERDIEPLGRVLQTLSKRYQYEDSRTPVILAFGASSGGAFVSGIATPLKEQFGLQVTGYLSQIAARRMDEEASCQVYITMDRDFRTDYNAKYLVDQANNTTNLSSKKRSRHIRLPPLPIRSDFFCSRIPSFTFEQSKTMVEILHAEGLLNKDGYLLQDPRQSRWREALQTSPLLLSDVLGADSLVADQSPIAEVLNVAYGMHEMARDGVQEAIEFCLIDIE